MRLTKWANLHGLIGPATGLAKPYGLGNETVFLCQSRGAPPSTRNLPSSELFTPQSSHRVNLCCPPTPYPAGQQPYECKKQSDPDKRQRLASSHTEKKSLQQARE